MNPGHVPHKFDFWFFSIKFVFTNRKLMKVILRLLTVAIVVGATTTLMNCGDSGGGGSSQEETQLKKLAGTWTMTTVTLDGNSRTGDFTDLKLTVSGTFNGTGGTYAYSFTGTRPNPSPWPASGTWQFDANPSSQIVRLDDGQKINYSLSNGDAQLTLEFNYQGAGFAGSRIQQVNGNWQFVFTK